MKKHKNQVNSELSNLQVAIDSHRRGDLSRAKVLYTEILKANPVHAESLNLLGVIEIQLGQWQNAVNLIAKSLALQPKHPGALNNHAIALKELGRFDDAIEQYLLSLQLKADDANTYMNLGNAYLGKRDFAQALVCFDLSIVFDPASVSTLINRAHALGAQGRHIDAINSYTLALRISPLDATIYNNLGNSLHAASHKEMAIDCYLKAIHFNPSYADAFFNLGNTLRDLAKLEQALEAYSKAIELNSQFADHFVNQGATYLELEQSAQAVDSFNRAIALQPGYAQAYNNLGNAYLELREYAQAHQSYSKCLALDPGYAQVYNNLGNLHKAQGERLAAQSSYERALKISPFFEEAHNNLGVLFSENLQTRQAIAQFERAITLRPDFADAQYNLANALRELKLFEHSITHYERTLCVSPNYPFLAGLLLHAKMHICDWRDYRELLEDITGATQAGLKVSPPFPVLALCDDLGLQERSALIWSDTKFPANEHVRQSHETAASQRNRKIKIGYFSADFRDHPVSYLMADLFEHHDKEAFEIVAFSLGPIKKDRMRTRLEKAFDVWVEGSELSDSQIAEHSRQLGIDIAVDLGGYTKNSRTGIFALRAAPVQVSYIGYLGTMGASYIDYLIADPVIVSPSERQFYSEQIAYLPIYQANDSKRQFSSTLVSRRELGIPEHAFVYACFNTNYKITPPTFELWMQILKSVDHSILYLYADTEEVVPNLREQASEHGVDPSRIYFGERLDQAEYLSRYTQMDLFLDTFPYNAGTTASDALWSGLPVLTRQGKSFASRMASSLLTALGMTELITLSEEDYLKVAVKLGRDPQWTAQIKQKLATQRTHSELFNTLVFTQRIESLYRKMFHRSEQGLKPMHIEL